MEFETISNSNEIVHYLFCTSLESRLSVLSTCTYFKTINVTFIEQTPHLFPEKNTVMSEQFGLIINAK